METTVDGRRFATPRGWEDLSRLIRVYEKLEKTVDKDVVVQYIQHPQIARDFASYLELFYKYRTDYQIDEVLSGHIDDILVKKAAHASFDEKLSVRDVEKLVKNLHKPAKPKKTDDKTMQEAFRSGFDIHTATAAQVFGVEPEQVTPLMRRHAKAVNFGIVYGISEFSLSEDIGVTRKEARQYIDNYLAHYAGVRTYMHEIVEQAKRDGYVTTLFGRRRELSELKSSNFNIRSFGERVALNTPIQGTAADIIKLAMIRVDAALRKQKLKARLVLQVHDELIVECPIKEAEQVKKIVTAEMENVVHLNVPLLAEAKSGASWYEAK